MNDQEFENLAKKYPDLFHKAETDYFGTGAGWANILDVLCGHISHRATQARYRLQYAKEKKQEDQYEQLEKDLADAIEELPVIMQVKEKFGGLRFYVHNGNEKIRNYISFAEAMSGCTCEECGAPGEPRNDGWVKVLCTKHHNERNKKDEVANVMPRITKATILPDETQ